MSSQPEADPSRVPLGEAVNVATRSLHTKLNKLVLSRLPLAMPPRADTPSVYITGLLHIAPIYITFESLWRDYIQQTSSEQTPGASPDSRLDQARTEFHVPETHYFTDATVPSERARSFKASEQVRSALIYVPVQGLERSARLRADIRNLTGWSPVEVEEQLRTIAMTGHLSVFLRHIERSVEKHPQVLLAYSWVLYMALFSGGRFIRASLENAGLSFWKELPTPVRPMMQECQKIVHAPSDDPEDGKEEIISDESHLRRTRAFTTPPPGNTRANPLAYFHFETSRDGEDLKVEFKRRLAEADALLSEKERDYVIREAVLIFENLISIISQLDLVCGTNLAGFGDNEPANMVVPFSPRLSSRFRDSIAVSKERACRAAMKREEEGSSADSEDAEAGSFEGQTSSDQVAEELREASTSPASRSRTPNSVTFEEKSAPTDTVGASGEPLSRFSFGSTDGAANTGLLIVGRRPPASKFSLSDRFLCVALIAAALAWVSIAR
ncbi:uncharacterized protein E0L32_012249 [Thyridium curvatum]|uniref:Heme oxygenase n=1 Tax=Thyridium curvatum TaxID=1093900 RepID=A0A507B4U2_9PEZI|nr:uncharacterized protein E0L32_012249 [Thyridium curvatum]TPX17282.1 hypothetical protein E0L32_012249 [Thyridium curvatum]